MNRAMTVTQLSDYLKCVFDDEELLHDVTLSGEVYEVSYSDKHTFVVLADGDCSVRCVHFSSRDRLEKGMKVALRGSVRFYGKRNSVSFAYDEFYLCGEGAKNARLVELKNKLAARGYFENRPQLPEYVLSVAAVTSPDGAAIRDLIRVVGDRAPFVKIRVYPVKVQGDGAAEQMAAAVRALDGAKIDAIVLCRGGGSDEDLDAFNDETLATAVAESRLPVISAVGHEVDYTLCDCCAGTRAGTPSIAGGIIAARAVALVDDIVLAAQRCRAALLAKYERRRTEVRYLATEVAHAAATGAERYRRSIESLSRRAAFAAERKLAAGKEPLMYTARRLGLAAQTMTAKKRLRLDKLSALVGALDPHKLIDGGYAAVYSGGRPVRSVEALATGDEIKLVFADGTATAKVSKTER